MTDQRSLILAIYAGFAGLILVAGFLYKEIRDRRENRKKPKQLPLAAPKHDHEHDGELVTHH